MSDPRLELSFDQYQRYRVAADVIAALGVMPPVRVLEVGGAPGPLEDFLPGFTTVVTDVTGRHEGRFALADGAALPFPDATFAAVAALDVLEHVPPAKRAPLLADLRRTSSDVVVLSAPFAHQELLLAEDALNEFVRARFGGDFATLDEHKAHGHPLLDETVASFRAAGWQVAVLPSGYLPHWLAAMLVHHELLATGLPELGKLHAYYNEVVSPLDTREPAYRHVIVASSARSESELERVVAGLRSEGDPTVGKVALASIATSVLGHRLDGAFHSPEIERLRDQLAGRDKELDDLRRQLADRDAHLAEQRQRNDELREQLIGQIQAFRDARLLGLAGLVRRLRARRRGETT